MWNAGALVTSEIVQIKNPFAIKSCLRRPWRGQAQIIQNLRKPNWGQNLSNPLLLGQSTLETETMAKQCTAKWSIIHVTSVNYLAEETSKYKQDKPAKKSIENSSF